MCVYVCVCVFPVAVYASEALEIYLVRDVCVCVCVCVCFLWLYTWVGGAGNVSGK